MSARSCGDDSGKLGPGDFHVVAAFRAPAGVELVVAWDGLEGQNLRLIRAETGVFRELAASYRYWVPE